jgi:hypothetical protein
VRDTLLKYRGTLVGGGDGHPARAESALQDVSELLHDEAVYARVWRHVDASHSRDIEQARAKGAPAAEIAALSSARARDLSRLSTQRHERLLAEAPLATAGAAASDADDDMGLSSGYRSDDDAAARQQQNGDGESGSGSDTYTYATTTDGSASSAGQSDVADPATWRGAAQQVDRSFDSTTSGVSSSNSTGSLRDAAAQLRALEDRLRGFVAQGGSSAQSRVAGEAIGLDDLPKDGFIFGHAGTQGQEQQQQQQQQQRSAAVVAEHLSRGLEQSRWNNMSPEEILSGIAPVPHHISQQQQQQQHQQQHAQESPAGGPAWVEPNRFRLAVGASQAIKGELASRIRHA